MIERYYNNAIEQVFSECGKISNNSLLIRYNNDFSVLNLILDATLLGPIIEIMSLFV